MTPPLLLQVTVVHMWERKMLSLEFRRPGCRFLGWTTHELPALSARRSRAVAEATSADGRAPSQQQEGPAGRTDGWVTSSTNRSAERRSRR